MKRIAVVLSAILVAGGMFDLALRTAPDGAGVAAAVPGLVVVGVGCLFALLSMVVE